MSLKCGIVGLPNVGKSTLFNALTKAGVAAENYPFCTIDPSVGIVEVPDKRLQQLSAIVKPQRIVPAQKSRRANREHGFMHDHLGMQTRPVPRRAAAANSDIGAGLLELDAAEAL